MVERFGQVRAVDVGDEMHAHLRHGKVVERTAYHPRAEVRSADADVHHVRDAPSGMACPCAAVHTVGKVAHLRAHAQHFGHDGLAVGTIVVFSAATQGHVQDGAVLGVVDAFATQHGVAQGEHAGFLSKLQQLGKRVGGDAVF